jgi:hypothetical protein
MPIIEKNSSAFITGSHQGVAGIDRQPTQLRRHQSRTLQSGPFRATIGQMATGHVEAQINGLSVTVTDFGRLGRFEPPCFDQQQGFSFSSRQALEASPESIVVSRDASPSERAHRNRLDNHPAQELAAQGVEGSDFQANGLFVGVVSPYLGQGRVDEFVGVRSVLRETERECPQGRNERKEVGFPFLVHGWHSPPG